MEKHFLTGNEAVARGIYEAGACLLPPIPEHDSEILKEYLNIRVYAEWATNESIMEAAISVANSGLRAMATMKVVGLNVAADPLCRFHCPA